jgi:NitT/TauT family transport system substrate-binding protein
MWAVTRVSLIVLFACGLVACTQPKENAVDAPKLTAVTIAQFSHIFLYLPVYVAKDNGYFKEAGLDVNLVSTGGDEKTFAAVSSGNAQFGVADPTFVPIARERGQGGKIVAQVVNGIPFWGVAFKDAIKPITKREDMSGLRIATFSAPSTSYTVMKDYLSNKGRPIKATIVQGAPTGSIVAMVKAGQADIAMELEPTASIAVAQGGHIVCSLQKEFGDFAITGLSTSEQYAKEHPEVVRGVVTSLDRAMKFIHSDFDGTLAIAKKEFPEIKEEILRNALIRMTEEGTIPKSPFMSKEGWDKAIALRKQVGDLTKGGEYETNVDMSFVEKQ